MATTVIFRPVPISHHSSSSISKLQKIADVLTRQDSLRLRVSFQDLAKGQSTLECVGLRQPRPAELTLCCPWPHISGLQIKYENKTSHLASVQTDHHALHTGICHLPLRQAQAVFRIILIGVDTAEVALLAVQEQP